MILIGNSQTSIPNFELKTYPVAQFIHFGEGVINICKPVFNDFLRLFIINITILYNVQYTEYSLSAYLLYLYVLYSEW